jgi:uncharacterized protein (TIGR00369 family)
MPSFEPRDPDYDSRVRASFARQTVMATIGARLEKLSPGEVEIGLPFRSDLCQQHGFMHAGIIATIADSSCGYAAFSLMAPEAAVLTVEYKLNLLAPARGERFVARGRALRPGKTLTVCAADVFALESGRETQVATMLATIMALVERPGLESGT